MTTSAGIPGSSPASVTDVPGQAPTVDRPDAFGKDTFLKLLVAQLRYQNPLDPADGSEFMAQTAQFTMVEKLEEIARQSSEALAADRMSTATSMLGRDVTYQGPDGLPATGAVTGVRVGPTGPTLLLGAVEVPLAAVLEVRTPPPPPTA